MTNLNLKVLKANLLSREEKNGIVIFKVNTEEGVKKFNSYYSGKPDIFLSKYGKECFYLITDGNVPLILRSMDNNYVFIVNPTDLMDNDIYLLNKYRTNRDSLLKLVKGK